MIKLHTQNNISTDLSGQVSGINLLKAGRNFVQPPDSIRPSRPPIKFDTKLYTKHNEIMLYINGPWLRDREGSLDHL